MRVLFAALLLVALLASGCVAPSAGPDQTLGAPEPSPVAPQAPPGLPNLTLVVTDLRTDPFAVPHVRLDVTFDRPLDRPFDLATGWGAAHDQADGMIEPVPLNATAWSAEHRPSVGTGDHTLRFAAEWDGHPETRAITEQDHTVWAPVRLILNASEQYAEGQNVFHSDRQVPFAPWDDESALHVLRRAADIHGFTVKTHHRADMDSHFVDSINGTAFRWELEPAGISRNWMILVEDKASSYAVDDTFPDPGQTLEFRYVRCYATGNCDDL